MNFIVNLMNKFNFGIFFLLRKYLLNCTEGTGKSIYLVFTIFPPRAGNDTLDVTLQFAIQSIFGKIFDISRATAHFYSSKALYTEKE